MSHRPLLTLGFTLALVIVTSLGLVQAQGPKPGNGAEPQVALGTAFTYQGRLTSGSTLVNAQCDFQFSLFDNITGGTQIGSTQTATNVSVSNGLFTTTIDFGSGAFNGNARWLQIAVRCPTGSGSYTALSPRQALTPVPYALYATGAPWSGIGGVPAGFADGVDNDTTYTAGAGLTLSGNQFSLAGSYQLPQGCTNGQTTKWNGSAWICASDNDTTTFWGLTGNGGTTAGTNFIGTTDNQALEFKVHNSRALRLEPNATSPNLIGGYSGNSVTSGVKGATISGGGQNGSTNRVTDDYGTVGGGINNRAGDNSGTTSDSSFATVGGGGNNTASGSAATVGGGGNNTASDSYATVGGGGNNTASDSYATVGGGGLNAASGSYATIPGGRLARASHYGELAYASGSFDYDEPGNAQTSLYVLRQQTPANDNTFHELFLDGSSERLTIAPGRTVAFEILVAARDNSGNSASYRFEGLIENIGSLNVVGSITVMTVREEVSAWDIIVDGDAPNSSLRIRATSGGAAAPVRWVAVVRTAEVGWPVP